MGFIRVAMVAHGFSAADARAMLRQLRRNGVGYLASLASLLPKWVEDHRQATDGHLCAVAVAHGLKLATFATGITDPAVERIP